MYLESVSKLANYLTTPGRNLGEICKFLILETFAHLHPRSIYLAEVIDDGHISHLANFGFDRNVVQNWGKFPLSVHIPITDAVKRSACIILSSQEESFIKYPALRNIPDYDSNWKSFISCPMQQYGAYTLVLDKEAPLDNYFEQFIKTVGTLIALHQVRQFSQAVPVFQRPRDSVVKQGMMLTPRQERIKVWIEKGMTNSEIAQEIGYSESLVRHETIEIYAKLNVSGRKELLNEEK